jgi:chromosomal replication initiator protein
MKDFEKRITSRFLSGLVIGITPPDVETAILIAKNKIENNHNLDPDIISYDGLEYLAINFSGSVRELEGAINRVIF